MSLNLNQMLVTLFLVTVARPSIIPRSHVTRSQAQPCVSVQQHVQLLEVF